MAARVGQERERGTCALEERADKREAVGLDVAGEVEGEHGREQQDQVGAPDGGHGRVGPVDARVEEAHGPDEHAEAERGAGGAHAAQSGARRRGQLTLGGEEERAGEQGPHDRPYEDLEHGEEQSAQSHARRQNTHRDSVVDGGEEGELGGTRRRCRLLMSCCCCCRLIVLLLLLLMMMMLIVVIGRRPVSVLERGRLARHCVIVDVVVAGLLVVVLQRGLMSHVAGQTRAEYVIERGAKVEYAPRHPLSLHASPLFFSFFLFLLLKN